MILARITHDISSNTLEAVWHVPVYDIDGITVMYYNPVKCRNYSIEQKLDFNTDLGASALKYTTMAGW